MRTAMCEGDDNAEITEIIYRAMRVKNRRKLPCEGTFRSDIFVLSAKY